MRSCLIAGSIAIVLGSAPSSAQMAYITNGNDNTVSVIDTATNTMMGTIPVGRFPLGVAVAPDGSQVYVVNGDDNTVSVIDVATNAVTAAIQIPGGCPNGNGIGGMGGGVGVAITSDGRTAYVTDQCSASQAVAVIDTATATVTGTFPALVVTYGVAVTPDGSKLYLTALRTGVLVTDTATGTVIASLDGGRGPKGIAVSPDGSTVYVADVAGVSIIDTATNTIVASVQLSAYAEDRWGVAVAPDGGKVYVTNFQDGTLSVVNTATNAIIATIPVGNGPVGVAVTPDNTKVYVVNRSDNTVSAIDTATNTVAAVLPVGNFPFGLGVFIQPRFAGTPGDANCHGKSISALARTFGGLNAAAIALGFPIVPALQTAVDAFCQG
jgi:YVTN family beta-propeller protein